MLELSIRNSNDVSPDADGDALYEGVSDIDILIVCEYDALGEAETVCEYEKLGVKDIDNVDE
jgi:hypothetical protein